MAALRGLTTTLVLAALLVATMGPTTTHAMDELEEDVNNIQQNMLTMARQMIMQQFYVEEQTRSQGHSGLKTLRNTKSGTRPYFTNSHVGNSMASIHNHANTIRTAGFGEFVAVLNGVEFRTRHNDYKLYMKCRNCTVYGATEDIPFPDVPPEVTQHTALTDQIVELRQWFKAWKDQDYSQRDYRKYFKPILCYLEGTWTTTDQASIDESFESDRHFLDAVSWLDMLDKVRFTSYSGGKSNLENFAYLPTSIVDIVNGSVPVLAQWNYKILCHPLAKDVPLTSLRPVDDLKVRMQFKLTLSDLPASRTARFQIHPTDTASQPWNEQSRQWTVLDDLMSEVPGLDNYVGDVRDEVFGIGALDFNVNEKPLNSAFYHRRYKMTKRGVAGLSSRARGFNDDTLFMAMTSSKKVAGMNVKSCRRADRPSTCMYTHQKWSYAIPLELIYMTPLNHWNPLGLVYKGNSRSEFGQTVFGIGNRTLNGRSAASPYNGTNSAVYYQTPSMFFGGEYDSTSADTTRDGVYAMDAQGGVHYVKASGTRIFLPEIPGVGVMRQRYPIMPIFGEGSAEWKELEALKDIVLEPTRYSHMFRPETASAGGDAQGPGLSADELAEEMDMDDMPAYSEVFLVTRESDPIYGAHTHDVTLSPEDMMALDGGFTVFVTTSEAEGHSHQLEVALEVRDGTSLFGIIHCDAILKCWDGHSIRLDPIRD